MNARTKRIAKDAAKTGWHTLTGIILLALKIIGTILLIFVTTGFIFALIFTMYAKTNLSNPPDVDLSEIAIGLSSEVYYQDRDTGEYKKLKTLNSTEVRKWVTYDEIPEYMEHAIVAIEDHRFYTHHGVDWFRTAGALVNMFLKQSDTFGGSTITQQLIKNVTNYDDVTIKRKLTEIFSALEFEKKYDKEQIIEAYLNYVNFGGTIYGVSAAAEYYFGKDLDELSLAECASIAGITNNPSMYNPFIDEEANKSRQEDILYVMKYQGYITEEEYEQAMNEKLELDWGGDDEDDNNDSLTGGVYTWFEDALINDLINDLMEEKGCSEEVANQLLFYGGYKIYSTLDPHIQECIDNIYEDLDEIPEVSGSSQQFQSAIVITDPYTGDVVGLSGGVGEKTQSLLWNRATDARRPMGSSIKPIASYGLAMNLGVLTPETRYDDSEDVTLNGTSWMTINFEHSYSGVITVREAIRRSVNTVAAQIIDQISPWTSYEFLTKTLEMDLDPNDASYAPMSLGELTYGATVREAAGAYSIFPNAGVFTGTRLYTYVLDSNDNIVLAKDRKMTPALSDTVAYWMIDIMKGSAAYGTDYYPYLNGIPFAGKTGTTSDTKDRWFIGYTPYYVAAVWTGYDIPARISAYGNPAAQLWYKVMSDIHSTLEYKDFFTPESTYLTPVPGVDPEVTYFIRCLDETGTIIQEQTESARNGKKIKVKAPTLDKYILLSPAEEVEYTVTDKAPGNVVEFVYRLKEPERPIEPEDPGEPDEP